jgi:hypothetical protein
MSSPEFSELVSAQNRTTHAVRAMAVYLLYSALFNVIGGVIIGIAFASGSASGGVVFGGVIVAVGNLIGLFNGLSELGKSNPANTGISQAVPTGTSANGSSAGTNPIHCKNCGEPNSWNAFRCTKCDGIVE